MSLRFWQALILAAVFHGGVAASLTGQEVLSLSWPTRSAAAPSSATPQDALYLQALRTAVASMPEANVVSLALTQSSSLGLSQADAAKLRVLVSHRYAAIIASPVFKDVSSSLGYCLSETRPRQGLALLYRPRHTDEHTPVIIFVHGYGGSFLWYQHQLAEWFPDHLILCPAYGIDPSDLSASYINESLAVAAARLKHPLAKPTLIGLSAGGFGTARVYAANPTPYRQLIVMAAYPPDDTFKAWPKSAQAGWIVGAKEYYVKDGGFASYVKSLAARSTRFQGVVIPNADHFFLLTHPTETRRQLQIWLK
ncbi:MAG: alpha/beta hydrolase [Opitutaceae bacterium]|jgi:pimeloyl-ACP methyl ester carboxylesterase